MVHWPQDTWQELIRNLEEDRMDDFLDEIYPELTLETDDIAMNLIIKKDYSRIRDFDERKEEFINDLKAFIDEFEETPESDDFVRYFDD